MKKYRARSVEQGAVSEDLAQGSGAPVGVSLLCTSLPAGHLAKPRFSPPVTRRSARRAGGAFTLIELLVVVAIIAILAALTLSTLGYVNRKGAESRARAEVAGLSAAIDSYRLDIGGYPASNNLYRELTGQGPINTNKIYFEPTAGIATNNQFMDPWGSPYRYETNPTSIVNRGFFDLWTTNNSTNPALWIRN
jgi:general secretion pathway protein G